MASTFDQKLEAAGCNMTPTTTPSPTTAELSSLARTLGRHSTSMAEAKELVRLVKPHFFAQLSSIPYFKALENDETFWQHFVGSKEKGAREFLYRCENHE